ncbi:Regulatory protein AtoC [Burkholderiaceae bacterium]|nr:Regulatory protein AtoC [Burkholderiaceae bacterium]
MGDTPRSLPTAAARAGDSAAAAAARDLLCLQLRSFVDDPQASERVSRLLGALGPCRIRRFCGEGASRVDERGDADDAGEPAPAAVVLLAGSQGLSRCCATMSALHRVWPGAPLIVFSLDVTDDELATLVMSGAFDFAMLSSSDAEIRLRVSRALGWDSGAARPSALVSEGEDRLRGLGSRLIGSTPEFQKMLRRVPAMAASNASVLLLGETGTGKEVCAQAIHYSSARARGPWVAINCAAIPAELVEDELFGHVRGAYTNAVGAREGLVHEAEGGTLFLDEIDSMPTAAQAKLLRFLQDKQYRAVGESRVRHADVRVIAASNRDLRLAALAGSFRMDLFFRLNVLNLTLPPLRERRDDIPMLAMHFLELANREAGRHLVGITPAALRCLQEHAWPGNVRELKHVLHRAVLLAEGPSVQAGDIELDGAAPAAEGPVSFREAKARAVEAFERHYLEELLAQSEGNITRAARSARKNRRALFELLRRHAIDAARYRGGMD